MRKKFVYPENMLTKNQILGLIIDSEESESGELEGDKGDLYGYAEMRFGEMLMDEGFSRYTENEVQDWYYREYLPDHEANIAEGFDRGQEDFKE